eukprot:Clim_evm5s75 gene=Clim_evmTU5s75
MPDMVQFSLANRMLYSAISDAAVWYQRCLKLGYLQEAKTRHPMAEMPQSFDNSWRTVYNFFRHQICVECRNDKLTSYTYIPLGVALCEVCERTHPEKYGLCTRLDALQFFLLEDTDLEPLTPVLIRSPKYRTPYIDFYSRAEIKSQCLTKFGTAENWRETLERRVQAINRAAAWNHPTLGAGPKQKKANGSSGGGSHKNSAVHHESYSLGNNANRKRKKHAARREGRKPSATQTEWSYEKDYILRQYGQHLSGLQRHEPNLREFGRHARPRSEIEAILRTTL